MDFSGLSNEQLLDLFKGTLAESIQRGINSIFQDEIVSTQEKAAIEFAVAEKLRLSKEQDERIKIAKEAEEKIKAELNKKEVEKVSNTWSIKAAAVKAIEMWGYDKDFDINIWSSGSDRRVYFQKTFANKKRTEWKFCLYITGNSYHPPMDLEGEGKECFFDDRMEELGRFLKAVSESWKGDVKIGSSYGSSIPDQETVSKYLKAIGVKESANV